MKTERRHDLETNELARHAASWIEKCKPHANQIFGTAIVIFGLLILVSLWGSTSNVKQQAAWDKFAEALNAGDRELFDLQQAATDAEFAGTTMQDWAQVTWADRQVALALANYFQDRESTQNRVEQVTPIYEGLLSNAKDEEIRNRAHFGLGRVYELENRFEEAREQYGKVRGTYERLAMARSESLLDPKVTENYAWLSAADLPKRNTPGASGEKPAFEAELPTGGFEGSSVEDILGLKGETGDDSSAKQPVEDKTEPPSFEIDEIFLDDGTTATEPPAATDSAVEEPAAEIQTEADTEAEAETAEP